MEDGYEYGSYNLRKSVPVTHYKNFEQIMGEVYVIFLFIVFMKGDKAKGNNSHKMYDFFIQSENCSGPTINVCIDSEDRWIVNLQQLRLFVIKFTMFCISTTNTKQPFLTGV